MNPFRGLYSSGAGWFPVGLTSSFPDLGEDDGNSLSEPRTCNGDVKPGCKVFQVPETDSSQASEMLVEDDPAEPSDIGADLKTQVLVFQYRGKFHAVDHKCPHSSFPLSRGAPFDIEDFGIVLSAGLSCPKHGWSFDLFSGMSDRGQYKLKVWEVQLRDVKSSLSFLPTGKTDDASGDVDKEVWVRRKQRIG
ncbi:Rieske domain-containing protein [Ilyonectria destructans]|nr:Rieske domain-containing protein [Ilyonectria destructans]